MSDPLTLRLVFEDGTPVMGDRIIQALIRAGAIRLGDGYIHSVTFSTEVADVTWRTPTAEQAIREAAAGIGVVEQALGALTEQLGRINARILSGPRREWHSENRLPKPRPF